MINYTVIIPQKNSSKLAIRCLESIPERSDIQIILVDDNSTETEKDILRTYLTSRSNVFPIFTNEGMGAGYARNVALSHTKGRWLLFSDSDDFFHENAFDEFDKYIDSDFDLIFYDIDSVNSDDLSPLPPRLRYLRKYISESDIKALRYGVVALWCKMYRTELIKNYGISFDNSKASNDINFTFLASLYAKKIHIINKVLYCSTINKNSLVHTMDKSKLDDRFNVGLKTSLLRHRAGVPEYQSNLLSLTLYYKNLGFRNFMSSLKRYTLMVPLKLKLYDLKLSLKNFRGAIKERKGVTIN